MIPTRRSSAEAFQILFSHALGDAGSPYLVGVMQDALRPYYANSTYNNTDSIFHPADMMTNLTNTTLDFTSTVATTLEPDNQYADFLVSTISCMRIRNDQP